MTWTVATPRSLANGLNPFGWLEEFDDSIWASEGSAIPGRWRETAEALEFQFDLPGIDRKDIDLVVEDGLLKIAARRHFWERPDGAQADVLHRTAVRLPETADPNRVEARLEQGVLRVRLHKRDEARARTITVE